MTKRMLIDALHVGETRMVIADEEFIEDFDFVTTSKNQYKGNIYLAKITRVEPSLQAAFVEYGGGKQGFLPFSEIHPDYYQIPVEDRKKLIEEEAEETAREEAEEEEALENREARRHDGRDRSDRGDRGERGDRRGGRRGRYGRNRNRSNRRFRDENGVQSEEQRAEEERFNAQQDSFAESSQPSENNFDPPADETPDESDTTYKAASAPSLEVSSDPLPEFEPEATDGQPENDSDSTTFLEESAHTHRPGRSEDESNGEDEDRVETVSEDDIEETRSRRKGASFKRYRIQEVIKRNQIVLVQVIKEERGNKGVSLTTYISLAGRYCVLMPNSPKAGGVSRKIGNGEQRKKLKEIVAELRDSRGLSAIIRTAGIDRTRTEIKRDYEYLVKLWQTIREDTLASTAPALIYEESDIIKRAIRDLYTNDIEQVLVQGENAYKDAKTFMKMIMPSHAPRVKQYKEGQPIFSYYGIEEQLDSMLDPVAKLPSGGYIVLHPTEALISIDVNSGRSTSERNVEETAIKTNLEAAREIARQLRLRDLAGLIVIDFIDMYYGRNRRTLEKAVKDALKHDRAKIQMSRISAFGLMELSRQRLRPSIAESSSITCPHCEGTGTVRSVETVAIQIIRLLEREAVTGEYTQLKVLASGDVVLHLFNHKRDMIRQIEEQYNLRVTLEIDTSLLTGKFRLMKTNQEGKETLHQDDNDRQNRRKGRRGRRGGRGRREDGTPQRQDARGQSDDADSDEDDLEDEETADTEEADHSPDFQRGRQRSKVRDDNDSSSESDEDGEEKAEGGEESSDARPRRRNRGGRGRGRDRNRRGGRDRNERAPGPNADGTVAESDAVASNNATGDESGSDETDSNDYQQHFTRDSEPDTLPPVTRNDERQDELEFADAESDSLNNDPNKPKRKGWWNR